MSENEKRPLGYYTPTESQHFSFKDQSICLTMAERVTYFKQLGFSSQNPKFKYFNQHYHLKVDCLQTFCFG